MKSSIRFEHVGFSLSGSCDPLVLADALTHRGLTEVEVSHPLGETWNLQFGPRALLEEPGPTIAEMLDAIERLDGEPRQLWKTCHRRALEITYKSGDVPWHLRPGLSNALLRRIAAVEASLDFTLIPDPRLRWWRGNDDTRTKYINTDLELRSANDLTPLAAVFDGNDWSRLHLGPTTESEWAASYETGEDVSEPELTILRFLEVIECLDAGLREMWNSCHLRELDLGYDSGDGKYCLMNAISRRTLERIAVAGLSLRFTIYGRPVEPVCPIRWLRRVNPWRVGTRR